MFSELTCISPEIIRKPIVLHLKIRIFKQMPVHLYQLINIHHQRLIGLENKSDKILEKGYIAELQNQIVIFKNKCELSPQFHLIP